MEFAGTMPPCQLNGKRLPSMRRPFIICPPADYLANLGEGLEADVAFGLRRGGWGGHPQSPGPANPFPSRSSLARNYSLVEQSPPYWSGRLYDRRLFSRMPGVYREFWFTRMLDPQKV